VLAPASPRPGTMRSPPSPPRNKLRVPRARGRELAQAKCRSVSGRPADVDTGRRTVLRPLVFLWSLTRLCRCAEVDNDPKTLVTEECRKTICAESWASYLEVSSSLRGVGQPHNQLVKPGRLPRAERAPCSEGAIRGMGTVYVLDGRQGALASRPPRVLLGRNAVVAWRLITRTC
jgi:hypothetical protein